MFHRESAAAMREVDGLEPRRLRLYLDNCVFCRPYDAQTQLRIQRETEAKLFIQRLIVENQVELVTSHVLCMENERGPNVNAKKCIADFIVKHTHLFVGANSSDEVVALARQICQTGIKTQDAFHIACAVYTECDFFVTTDDRLLKYRPKTLRVVNPIQMKQILEATP
ncbi:MAG: hypothetical protein ACRC46_11925 [Thermoguttaceae bacterium]